MAKKRLIQSNMQTDPEALFVKILVPNCTSGDMVLVDESSTAILIKNGQMQQTLSAGKHQILRFGTPNDEFAVVFLPKTTKIKMLWGTKEQFSFRDPVEDVSLRVGANGEIDVQVVSPRKFFLELGRQKDVFKTSDLKENIQNKLISYIEQFISTYMQEQKISYDRLDENKTFVAREIRPYVSNELEKDFGIRISSLTINGVIIPPQFLQEIAQAKQQRLGLNNQKMQELIEEENKKQEIAQQIATKQQQKQEEKVQEATRPTIQKEQVIEPEKQKEQEQEQDGMLLL